jgi:hypothetical protein
MRRQVGHGEKRVQKARRPPRAPRPLGGAWNPGNLGRHVAGIYGGALIAPCVGPAIGNRTTNVEPWLG